MKIFHQKASVLINDTKGDKINLFEDQINNLKNNPEVNMPYFENFMKVDQPLKSQCRLYNVAVRTDGYELVRDIFGGFKKREEKK